MSNIPLILNRAIKRLRTEGPIRTLDVAAYHLGELGYDWWYGTRTCGYVTLNELGLNQGHGHDYAPVEADSLRKIISGLKLRPGQDVFIDYGSGMGRALIAAASWPFRTIIGVELSAQLNEIAERNIAKVRKTLKCADVQVITANAMTYMPPPETTVFFFFNPFMGEVLSAVLENIHQSLLSAPRPITLIYEPPRGQTHTMLDTLDWMTRPKIFRTRLGRDVFIYHNDFNSHS